MNSQGRQGLELTRGPQGRAQRRARPTQLCIPGTQPPHGPAHSRCSLCPSCVYTQAPTQTLRCAGPTTARPQLAANLPSTWNSASSWKAFGHQEQMTLLKAEMIMVFSPNQVEKAMAPHSSTLAWRTPRTEEPGRLQSMGSRRVGHD